jgi:hypothetical protein
VRFFALAFVAAATVIPALQASADEPTAVPAAAAAPAATAPAATASADADQIVCKTGAAATGTRLGRTRECHTQREWDRMRQDEQSSLVRTQTQITTGVQGH